MDKKSKFLIRFFVLMMILTIVASYYRFFVIRDYDIVRLETIDTTQSE